MLVLGSLEPGGYFFEGNNPNRKSTLLWFYTDWSSRTASGAADIFKVVYPLQCFRKQTLLQVPKRWDHWGVEEALAKARQSDFQTIEEDEARVAWRTETCCQGEMSGLFFFCFFSHCCSVVCYLSVWFPKSNPVEERYDTLLRLLSWYRLVQRTRSSGWHIPSYSMRATNLLVPKVISHVEFMWSWPEHCPGPMTQSHDLPISTWHENPSFLSARIENWYFHRLGMTRPYRTPLYL